MKCGGASWYKMAGTNGEDDILSNARNIRYKLLHGERDLFIRLLLIRGCPDGEVKKNHLWMRIERGFGVRLDCNGEVLWSWCTR